MVVLKNCKLFSHSPPASWSSQQVDRKFFQVGRADVWKSHILESYLEREEVVFSHSTHVCLVLITLYRAAVVLTRFSESELVRNAGYSWG